MKTETKISVWVDVTSATKGIIVSRDTDEYSDTIKVFLSMDLAVRFAKKEAKRLGLQAVIEKPAQSGQWEAL